MTVEDDRAQQIADGLAEALEGLTVSGVWAEARPEARMIVGLELDNGTKIRMDCKSLSIGGDAL